MTRVFFLTDSKHTRVKLAVKNYQTYLLLQSVVEKKNGEYFWEPKYLENYIIMPEEVQAIAPYNEEHFWKHKFSNQLPSEVEYITMDDLNLGDIIYDTFKNYEERENRLTEAKEFIDTVNLWEKELIKTIEEADEISIDVDDD